MVEIDFPEPGLREDIHDFVAQKLAQGASRFLLYGSRVSHGDHSGNDLDTLAVFPGTEAQIICYERHRGPRSSVLFHHRDISEPLLSDIEQCVETVTIA